jgi:hypothetical protein
MNDDYLQITYSGFYDVPLAFTVHHTGDTYLFWRGYFDEEIDDYPERYCVYKISPEAESELIKHWDLDAIEKHEVGHIPVRDVIFDSTKRRAINILVFEELGKQ